jgi:hypothetical protein
MEGIVLNRNKALRRGFNLSRTGGDQNDGDFVDTVKNIWLP